MKGGVINYTAFFLGNYLHGVHLHEPHAVQSQGGEFTESLRLILPITISLSFVLGTKNDVSDA